MSGVIYCEYGDWPPLTDEKRLKAFAALWSWCSSGGWYRSSESAISSCSCCPRWICCRKRPDVIPRVLSRGTSTIAQRHHFAGILGAAPDTPAVIYNSPYYGFQTRAELFFELRSEFPNLVGFKEFGSAEALSYAAAILLPLRSHCVWWLGRYSGIPRLRQLWCCWSDYWYRNAILPKSLNWSNYVNARYRRGSGTSLCQRTGWGLDCSVDLWRRPDLVLFTNIYWYLTGLNTRCTSMRRTSYASQRYFVEQQYAQFKAWWDQWDGKDY